MSFGVFLLSCGVWALMLMWWFREYVDAIFKRRPGESFQQAFERAGAERALRKEARALMFGGRLLTAFVSFAALLFTMVTVFWAGLGYWIGLILLAYLCVGFGVVWWRLRPSKHRSWGRLGLGDRVAFLLGHAWLWPIHIVSASH